MGPQGSEHAEQLSTAHRGSSAYCALWPKRKEKNYIYIYKKYKDTEFNNEAKNY